MRKNSSWVMVLLFVAACARPACLVAENKPQNDDLLNDLLKEQDKWFSQARKRLLDGAQLPLRRSDDLFNDEFLGRRYDPFAGRENLRGRVSSHVPNYEQPLSERAWNDQFGDRMDVGDIMLEVKTTDKEVILTLRSSNLHGGSLNININDDRIRISCDAKMIQSQKDAAGREYFKSESLRRLETIMPIPDGADHRPNRIIHEGDTVKVIFAKSTSPRRKAPEGPHAESRGGTNSLAGDLVRAQASMSMSKWR